ncbi:MAG: DinB family protein [Chloroflexota bacterium]
MGERSKALADDFEKAVAEFADAVEAVPDSKWGTMGADGWTLGVTAEHVAGQFPLEMEFITAAAEGKKMPDYSMDDVNSMNDKRAAKNAGVTKDQVLKTLRDSSASTAAYVRGLSDEQLDRKTAFPLANGAMVSTEQLLLGGVLIDHVRGHTKSIQAAS